ncbi:MAG: formimidoylglutamate deiminase [Candidatus Cyclobacteriaceae bacterium M2_1C_046]
MKGYKFVGLRQKNSWLSPAFITVDTKGFVSYIGKEPEPHIQYEEVKGLALPAIPNAHSHAFQYAMAGLAEVHPKQQAANDFWSWRNKMYEVALSVDPEDVESIATMLYAEMVKHGYSHVAEFHYLHNDQQGRPYENIAEMSERLISAAHTAGINITIIPMLYRQGGFGKPPEENQRRFISKSIEDYINLTENAIRLSEQYPHARAGFGAHSLRAAAKEDIQQALDTFGSELPFHIHISEQLKEVEEAIQTLGARPVKWLLDNFDINENFHLVHATHLDESEIKGIASSGANVILCPSTEGNLGDGIFPLHQYMQNNGKWCIGTDSHIGLNPLEEIRLLDYGQRLTSHKRNTFLADNSNSENAAVAFSHVIQNGRKAMGIDGGIEFFELGKPFNAFVIDSYHPLLSSSDQYWLSTVTYHMDASNIYGTMINGNWIVKGGFHIEQLSIRQNFRNTLKKLKIRNR